MSRHPSLPPILSSLLSGGPRCDPRLINPVAISRGDKRGARPAVRHSIGGHRARTDRRTPSARRIVAAVRFESVASYCMSRHRKRDYGVMRVPQNQDGLNAKRWRGPASPVLPSSAAGLRTINFPIPEPRESPASSSVRRWSQARATSVSSIVSLVVSHDRTDRSRSRDLVRRLDGG